MNSTKNYKVNENTQKFIKSTTDKIIYTRQKYIMVKNSINNTPLLIKILNITIPFCLTYIFSYIYYNLTLSIIFAILTFLIIFILSKTMAFIFLVLYIVVIVNITKEKNKIQQTSLIVSPYDCKSGALTVQTSKIPNTLLGSNFSYSYWIYLSNVSTDEYNWNTYRNKEWKSVFYRGSPITSNDLSTLIQFPGFWLTPVYNNLVIVFQYDSYVERIELIDIPFNKWTNIIVVVETKSVSVYIDGLLEKILSLSQNIITMNSYNLYVTNDAITSSSGKGGYAGNLAELIYYNFALNPEYVKKVYDYYKNIIHKYEKNNQNDSYQTSELITNSDYLCKK